ncbi:MAG: transcriptional coactivator p15/PC4 family protein [Candidatus Bathyarchaeia archaeon]
MIKKVKDPLDEASRLAFEKTRKAMNNKLSRVSPIHIEVRSAPGYESELRIGFRTYKDRGYIDMRIWFLKDNEWLPTRRGVSVSPYYVLAAVIEALKRATKGKDSLVYKGRRPGAKRQDLIRVTVETTASDEFVSQIVRLRTWSREAVEYEAREGGLAIPSHLLPQVIGTLEEFAKAVGEVNGKYLRPLRLVEAPDL